MKKKIKLRQLKKAGNYRALPFPITHDLLTQITLYDTYTADGVFANCLCISGIV